jgi:hypothetical protein
MRTAYLCSRTRAQAPDSSSNALTMAQLRSGAACLRPHQDTPASLLLVEPSPGHTSFVQQHHFQGNIQHLVFQARPTISKSIWLIKIVSLYQSFKNLAGPNEESVMVESRINKGHRSDLIIRMDVIELVEIRMNWLKLQKLANCRFNAY